MTYPNCKNLVAVFGGAFDPPHLGHREAAIGLFEIPGVMKLLVIPSGQPPLKEKPTAYQHRLTMAKLNFSEIENLEISTIEDSQSSPSYTIDTLRELKKSHDTTAFVAGSDQINDFKKWHRFPEILSITNWIILHRKPEEESEVVSKLDELVKQSILKKMESKVWTTQSGTWLCLVPTKAREVSATNIRLNFLENSKNLKPEVIEYMRQNNLYGI